jgi:DNA-binding transcriptional ArsR family regulator
VLGHPARVRILELLRDGERSVGSLQTELGLDSGSTSQHLAALRRIGLVESRREGTSVYYRVDDEHVFELLEAGREIISRRLASTAVDAARAQSDVIGALLLVGLGAVAAGRSASAWRIHALRRGAPRAGRGMAAVGSPASGRSARATPRAPRSRAPSSEASVSTALTGFFLGTLGVVAAPALAFASRYLEPTRGAALGGLTAAFLLVARPSCAPATR